MTTNEFYFPIDIDDRKGNPITVELRAVDVLVPQEVLDLGFEGRGMHNWVNQFPPIGDEQTRRIPAIQWRALRRAATKEFAASARTLLDEKTFYEAMNVPQELRIMHALVPLTKKQRTKTDVARVVPIWLLHHFFLLCCGPNVCRRLGTVAVFLSIRDKCLSLDKRLSMAPVVCMLDIYKHIIDVEYKPVDVPSTSVENVIVPVSRKRTRENDGANDKMAQLTARVSALEDLNARLVWYIENHVAPFVDKMMENHAAGNVAAVQDIVELPRPLGLPARIEGDLV